MTDDKLDALITELQAAYNEHTESCRFEGGEDNACACAEGCYRAARMLRDMRDEFNRKVELLVRGNLILRDERNAARALLTAEKTE